MLNVNQYAYTLGNPVWFVDPSGRDFESVLEGILVTAGLAVATVSLFFITSPVLAVLGGVSMTLAGLAFAIWVARRVNGTGSGSNGVAAPAPDGSASRDRGGATGANQSCSPVRLASVPGLGRLHWILIAAQLLLAPLLIRSWPAHRRRRSR